MATITANYTTDAKSTQLTGNNKKVIKNVSVLNITINITNSEIDDGEIWVFDQIIPYVKSQTTYTLEYETTGSLEQTTKISLVRTNNQGTYDLYATYTLDFGTTILYSPYSIGDEYGDFSITKAENTDNFFTAKFYYTIDSINFGAVQNTPNVSVTLKDFNTGKESAKINVPFTTTTIGNKIKVSVNTNITYPTKDKDGSTNNFKDSTTVYAYFNTGDSVEVIQFLFGQIIGGRPLIRKGKEIIKVNGRMEVVNYSSEKNYYPAILCDGLCGGYRTDMPDLMNQNEYVSRNQNGGEPTKDTKHPIGKIGSEYYPFNNLYVENINGSSYDYVSGDVYSVSHYIGAGFITNSGKDYLLATFFTPKSMKNIESVSLNDNGKLLVRQNNKYLVGSASGGSTMNLSYCSARKTGDNAIEIIFKATSAVSGVINNDSIGVEMSDISITMN